MTEYNVVCEKMYVKKMRENFASRIFCINFAEENYPKRETFLMEKREKFPKMENHSTEEYIFSFPKNETSASENQRPQTHNIP